MPPAAAISAVRGVRPGWCSDRKRTVNWMPKSIPRPTKSGMNATEITLKR